MGMRAIILGCGSSGGVPRIGGDWGICDPNEPKNARTRSSILLQKWEGAGEPNPNTCTNILIDTSPDLRIQLLREDIRHIDAVFYTHDHADQSHGIDDLRAIAYRMRAQIPTYMDAHTKLHVFDRFKYCFEMPEGRVHPPIRYSQHPTHAHADKALSWLARARVKSAVLTNLHIDMDYATLSDELPPIIKPAFDGMRVSPPA